MTPITPAAPTKSKDLYDVLNTLIVLAALCLSSLYLCFSAFVFTRSVARQIILGSQVTLVGWVKKPAPLETTQQLLDFLAANPTESQPLTKRNELWSKKAGQAEKDYFSKLPLEELEKKRAAMKKVQTQIQSLDKEYGAYHKRTNALETLTQAGIHAALSLVIFVILWRRFLSKALKTWA